MAKLLLKLLFFNIKLKTQDLHTHTHMVEIDKIESYTYLGKLVCDIATVPIDRSVMLLSNLSPTLLHSLRSNL